jgi:hypothetical protein
VYIQSLFFLADQRIPCGYTKKTELEWRIFTKLYINIAIRNESFEQADLQIQKYS